MKTTVGSGASHLILAALFGAIVFPCVAGAEAATPQTSPPAGKELYASKCAPCHGSTLLGQGAPALRGLNFKEKWGSSRDALIDFIHRNKPLGAPVKLDVPTSQQIADFVLAVNGIGDKAALEAASVIAASPAFSDAISQAHDQHLRSVAAALTPVTDAMLQSPPAGDWLNWRADANSTGYSRLTRVNKATVGRLRLAWSKALGPGTNGVHPLAHDGVIFIHSGGVITAIDGATGDTIWKTDESTSTERGQRRGLSLYGSSLYTSTRNNEVMALVARTGEVLWRAKPDHIDGKFASGPIVARGRVFQPAAMCAGGGLRCSMTALDAADGHTLWQFHTIPGKGETGAESWGNAPVDQWSGAGIWSQATYDFKADAVVFGTGNSYATSAMLSDNPRKPVPALFTNSTIKLDAKTGSPRWYFQHVAGDVWDEDWTFERILVKNPRGTTGWQVINIGKLGIIDALDNDTGNYLWSIDMGLQDIVLKIDAKTGLKTTDPDKIPLPGKDVASCPFGGGVRNWPATAYDPERSTLYVPFMDVCQEVRVDASTRQGSFFTVKPRPASDHKFGGLTAINLRTGERVWTDRYRAPQASAALATAGGVVFHGYRDRWFRASDSDTGKVLWQARLNDSPTSMPISFEAGGKQYIVVVTGGGTYLDDFLTSLTPGFDESSGRLTVWAFTVDR